MLRLWADDPEFAHAVIERGAVHAETRGGAGWATDYPLRIAENFKNVIALDGFECRCRRWRGSQPWLPVSTHPAALRAIEPRERITARSTRFCSSRMLPGQ